ncbi:MAG: radical SAM protein [Firmicutes bacterium]|nr:radical SAM protein [Bacillota bacterium]
MMDRKEMIEILRMPEDLFRNEVMPVARAAYKEADNTLYGTAMLGYSNICRSQCLYCGMRAGSKIPRFRLSEEDVIASAKLAKESGFSRIFLISGEDPGYGYEHLLRIVDGIHTLGMKEIMLACGEFSRTQYQELKAAGATEYVIKYEMAQKDVFDRLNPSTNFEKRMEAIENVKESGLKLASGNIVDYPGQTEEMILEDIELMAKLGISWAPVVPYMPAKGTPLAEGAKPGERLKILKEIAILRLMMPKIRITAQQPGDDLSEGLATEQGNLDALMAGGNILFCDLLPAAKMKDFHVVDFRDLKGVDHFQKMADISGMKLSL